MASDERVAGPGNARNLERKTPPVSLGVPLGWPQRSGGQAPEADALSTELQARGPAVYRRVRACLVTGAPETAGRA
jgi:hypothetical protein